MTQEQLNLLPHPISVWIILLILCGVYRFIDWAVFKMRSALWVYKNPNGGRAQWEIINTIGMSDRYELIPPDPEVVGWVNEYSDHFGSIFNSKEGAKRCSDTRFMNIYRIERYHSDQMVDIKAGDLVLRREEGK